MRAVMLDVPESLPDERRRLGLDVFDELWEGVLHTVPPPSGEHQRHLLTVETADRARLRVTTDDVTANC